MFMNRVPTGTFFKRGRRYWYKFKHQGQSYAFSLKTTHAIQARKDFEHEMTLIGASIMNGTFDPEAGKDSGQSAGAVNLTALSHAWKSYLKSVNRPSTGEKTLEQYGYQFRHFVKWMDKRYPQIKHMAEVNKAIARQFAMHLKSKYAPNTFNKHVNLLRLVFRIWADNADVSGPNPWSGIARERLTTQSKRPFTDNELKAIFKKAEGDRRTLFFLGLHTGLRLGDCCCLQWNQIDMKARMITVTPRKTRNSSGKTVTIPIHPELYIHLSSIMPAKTSASVLPDFEERYLRDDASISDEIQGFLTDIGITVLKSGTGSGTDHRAVVLVGFHSFRHTWVTRAAEAGMDSASIRAIVGWGSPAMEKIYTHVSKEHLASVFANIPPITEDAVQKTTPPVSTEIQTLSDDKLKQLSLSIQSELEQRAKSA